MGLIIKLILSGIMFLVQKIRGDAFHYLSAPEAALPDVKKRHVMLGSHTYPSLVVAFLIGLWGLPYFSESYAARLEENDLIVPQTIGIAFLLVLFLNGWIVELYLEKYKPGYKTAKVQYQKGDPLKAIKEDADDALDFFLDE